MTDSPNLPDDEIDLAELFARLMRGLPFSIGLGLLGLALGAVAYVAAGGFLNAATSTRVVFSFPGFEKGEYPDGSKFSPYDLRSPEIIAEALRRTGLDATEEVQGKVRAALSVEGLIPDTVVKERDKQRALGQTPRVYVPDEYSITLTLPRKFPLSSQQRRQLVDEIVSIYREKFTRTYVALPLDMGKAFQALADADYYDYDIVLRRESGNLNAFLVNLSDKARAFRSPRTNLTFNDLLKQADFFTQIRLNGVLALIRRDGLSKDRALAVLKMDYHLKTLGEDERLALEEEKVVADLLRQAQEREQRYALGVKSPSSNQQRADGLVVDQGLVDSLVANDSYNYLIRQALAAGLKTRRVQAEKAILQERRDAMQALLGSGAGLQASQLAQLQASLAALQKTYEALIDDVRQTYEDFQRQQFGDAIRVSMQAKSESFYRSLALAGIAGLGIGGSLGLGLSLLGVGFGRTKST